MTDIPDIKAALLDGRRYPYDFVRDLRGPRERSQAGQRTAVVDGLLDVDESGGEALYVLLVAGARRMLDAVAESRAFHDGDLQKIATDLRAMLEDAQALDDLARNPESKLRPY